MSSPATADTFTRAHCLGTNLHDGRGDGESLAALVARHCAAVEVCSGCPCVDPCVRLYRSMPRSARGFGVWAGRSADLGHLRPEEDTA